ncbi:hypothetical protein RhiirA5_415009 [Rhizophagus irregularis]|uniref:Uncharacterized protein n=1 Tax=Rhizophagus irregularis TaxID=588596 RepID=A0A2I1ESG0_9GLOM|nr:hypothetical protein RhiirA5_415009 [Rhizophagus irregularis]PKC57114.1 hypothetical protein RhiirA1_472988 [Rhizophagus irregularis]PKY25066.1 hypothetical protein RhiirB3_439855 [Rhizophagus irregularis]CAB4472902.1 unnamed protein product [Rhizophagus irregularis]
MNYREKGNKAFVYGGFETARQEYTKGIEVTPEEPRLWSTMRKSSLNLVVNIKVLDREKQRHWRSAMDSI